MNRNDWESHLYAAKPTNDEIAPLSPEASSRILSAALRENRRRNKPSFWLAAPLRVAMSSMAVAAVVYCMVPYINPSDMPTTRQSPPTVAETLPVNVPDKVAPGLHKPLSRGKSAKTLPKPSALPVLPSTAPKPVKPQVMVARNLAPLSVPERGASRGGNVSLAGKRPAPQLSPLRHGEGGEVPGEGDMFVSVSGGNVLPPEGESDDALTITVKHDVPDTVAGSAEAAALQSVPVPGPAPNPADTQAVPVWTHVRVETGEEPVLTLTALN